MVSDIQVSPDGHITGALLYEPVPEQDNELLPRALVLLRDGKYQREIRSGPFTWRWMFWQGSNRIVADTGPLHYMHRLTLIDVSSGEGLAAIEVGQEPVMPAWGQTLSELENKPVPNDPVREDCRSRPNPPQ